jgi:hypothetical protein
MSESRGTSKIPDHHHVETWTLREQERFEDRITEELHGLRDDVNKLAGRIAWLVGGISVLVFLTTLLAPLIRDLFNVPVI